MLVDHTVTARLPLPDLIVRGVDTVISCPLYAGAALVVPVSGTCTVYDAGYVVVSSGPIVTTASIATYTVQDTDTVDLDPADRWQVYWDLVTASGPLTPRNDAALVRTALHPVIGDVDLIRRVPALDPDSVDPITRATTYQDFLDEAWTELQRRLLDDGRRPWLVLAPGQLRAPHLFLTLALIFEDLASRLNIAYETRAQDYRGQYVTAWDRVVLRYDLDQDGQDDDSADQPAAVSTVFLTGRR